MIALRAGLWLLSLPLVVAIGCGDDAAGGEEDVEAGVSCFAADECGQLDCHCVRDDGEFPGVCSTLCETDADCASAHGEEFTCNLDFCEGVNVCLNMTE